MDLLHATYILGVVGCWQNIADRSTCLNIYSTMAVLLLLLVAFVAANIEEKPIQFQTMSDRGTYDFGYDTGIHGAHSLRRESKDENGIVRGKYSYTDPNGKLRTVVYEAGPFGFHAKGDVGPDGFPESEVGVPIIVSDINGTIISDSNDYVADASSHPNRETKGYVYDPSSHPSVHNRLFIPNPPPSPPVAPPVIHVVHDESVHPNSRSKGYVHNAILPPVAPPSPPISRPLPPVASPVVRVPDASSHPNSRSKGYVHNLPSPPVVRPPSRPVVTPPPRPVAPPVIRIPDASSHPNSRSKGYVHNVPSPPIRPVSPISHVHEASSHPNSRSKGYVHDTSQQNIHVHSNFVHRKPEQPHVHESSSHSNSRTKAYVPPIQARKVESPSRSQIISVSRSSSVSITRASDRTKGYVNSRSQATINRPVSRSTYTKGYVSNSRSQASVQRPVNRPTYTKPRPSPPVHVHEASSHPNSRSKGYVHSASSHRVVPPVVHVHDSSSHPNSRSKGYVHDPSIPIPSSHFHVGESRIHSSKVSPKSNNNDNIPYMSAEEYIARYRSGRDTKS